MTEHLYFGRWWPRSLCPPMCAQALLPAMPSQKCSVFHPCMSSSGLTRAPALEAGLVETPSWRHRHISDPPPSPQGSSGDGRVSSKMLERRERRQQLQLRRLQ